MLKSLSFLLLVCTFALLGCRSVELRRTEPLTAPEAAVLAAELANEQCATDFGRKPFAPENDRAEFVDERWRWGRWDPAGIDGYSAIVTFDAWGSDPEVQIFYSVDLMNHHPQSKSLSQ